MNGLNSLWGGFGNFFGNAFSNIGKVGGNMFNTLSGFGQGGSNPIKANYDFTGSGLMFDGNMPTNNGIVTPAMTGMAQGANQLGLNTGNSWLGKFLGAETTPGLIQAGMSIPNYFLLKNSIEDSNKFEKYKYRDQTNREARAYNDARAQHARTMANPVNYTTDANGNLIATVGKSSIQPTEAEAMAQWGMPYA
jgi:hypothetical protein